MLKPTPARPVALPVSFDRIPEGLTGAPQFVGWRYERRGDAWTKPPICLQTGQHASVTDPQTWTTYEIALRCYQDGTCDLDGLGYVLTEADGIVGFDFDHCRNPDTSEIDPWAWELIQQLNSYTEVTPSTTGFRTFTYGTFTDPKQGRRRGDFEMYRGERFLTLTGCHLDGTPTTIERPQAAIDAIYAQFFRQPARPPEAPRTNGHRPPLEDAALLEKALNARNGGKLARLWAGDIRGYPSPSEAELALCTVLAFWTPDAVQIDRLVRASALYRDKWERADYRDATIAKALQQTTKHWTPPRSPHASTNGHAAPHAPDDADETIIESPQQPLPLSDQTNAEALVRWYGQDLHYCYPWKSWLIWDQTRWVRDDTGQVMRLAKHTIKRLAAAVETITDEAKVKAWLEHIKRSLATPRLKAIVESAQSEPHVAIAPNAFDADPWLLNCANGTLDLRRGQLQSHQRGDLLTKLIPVAYDPHATCPLWDSFLWRIMGGPLPDEEGHEQTLLDRHDRATRLMAFLQRAIGYALTGDTSEQCLFLFHGPGANGKSTLIELILALLGDYARSAEFSTFLDRPHEHAIRNDIADLRGARFVSAIEAAEGKRLAEVLMKQLTGGDTIKARFLFQEYFEFTPQFKLFLAANHRPVIRGTDHAIWRRIRLVPFTVTIPKEEQDKQLAKKLRQELPGILGWAVKGCCAWQRHGLGEPEEVIEATKTYRAEMDVLGDFLEDACFLSPGVKVTSKALFDAYAVWCDKNGEPRLSRKALATRLEERGCRPEKGTHGVRWWLGIGLCASPESGGASG